MKLRSVFLTVSMLSGVTFQAVSADWLCITINRRQQKFRNKTDAEKKYLESNRNGSQRRYNPCGGRKCGWIDSKKPVNLIGGYNTDFSTRNPLIHHTMLRPKNEQNATRPALGTLTIKTRKFGANASVLIDGFIFDHTAANSYHPAEGKPEFFSDGMLKIPPAKGNTRGNDKTKAVTLEDNIFFLNKTADVSVTIRPSISDLFGNAKRNSSVSHFKRANI